MARRQGHTEEEGRRLADQRDHTAHCFAGACRGGSKGFRRVYEARTSGRDFLAAAVFGFSAVNGVRTERISC